MGKAMAQSGLMMYCVQAVRMEYHSVYIVDGVCTTVTTTRMLLLFVTVSRSLRECVNSGMDYWNSGIVEWKFLKFIFKFYIHIRHTSL